MRKHKQQGTGLCVQPERRDRTPAYQPAYKGRACKSQGGRQANGQAAGQLPAKQKAARA